MEISRKSGIKTVKHTKVNDELYELISQESEKFAGGIEEFQREAYARYFENQPKVISLIHPADISERIHTLPNKVSVDTRLFFNHISEETGDFVENLVGELLTRFSENPANIPTIVRKPVEVLEPLNPQPQPEPATVEFDSLDFPQDSPKPANIIKINLDELVLDYVINDLKRLGFNEMKYMTKEIEESSFKTFENLMRERLAQKDTIIENLRNSANPTEEMKKGFKGLLDFSVLLYQSHIERNGVKGLFSRITKEHMMEVCPNDLKHFFN